MYETNLTMVGRVATPPERKQFDGAVKASFRLARTERRFDRDKQEWVDGASLYLTVVCWRGTAERVLGSLSKGDPVIVRGRLHSREWEKDGKRHSIVELDAFAIGLDLASCTMTVLRRPIPVGAASTAELPPEPDLDPADEQPVWDSRPLAAGPYSPTSEASEAAVGL